MKKTLVVKNQIITTVEELRSCFTQPEASLSNSPLFNELIDRFVDGDIESFLRTIGEESLAEKVKGIVIGNSDSDIMRQLLTIITGTESKVDFDFRSCMEVVETTVKGNKAIFKLRVLKRVNENPFMISISQPGLFWKALKMGMKGDQNQFRQDKDKNQIKTAVRIGAEILTLNYLFANFGVVRKVLSEKLSEKVDQNQILKDLGIMNFKTIIPNQYQQNDRIELEAGINPEYDVWFGVGKESAGVISAETIAYNNYCESYGTSTYYDADRIKAISENAKKGWSRFQDLLGDVYRYGYGVDKSYKDAFSWYKKSAEKGCTSAQCSLGEMYLYGKGVDVDYAEALKWFQKSSDQGDAMGQCRLGFMYEKGKGGLEVDFSKASDLYSMAAAQNNPFGQCLLGRLYEKGLGVTKDINRALELYLKSAMQDDAMGQIHLGILIENNLSFDKDLEMVAVPVEIRLKYPLLSDLFNKVIYYGGSGDFVFDENELINSLRNLYRYAGNNLYAWEKYNWNNSGKMEKTNEFFPAAGLGSAYCLFMLGMISKSDSEKVQLFEKAAFKEGYFAAYASIIMGYRRENGNGVRRNQSLAESYYGSAIRFFGKEVVEKSIREIKEDLEKYDRFWDSWNM